MKKALIGKKVGMTQIFDEEGKVIPVTAIEVGPCTVTQIKTVEQDGYSAVQLGFGEIKEKMISKLKIIPLGGLGEIGKNMTAFEFGGDIIVVDCGMGFPDQDLYGVDMVIPDISYLKANKNRIRGMVITHGHEDHVCAQAA